MSASHHAVIIFFVISGFSVAYSSAKEGYSAERFLAARLSRIVSVAIPAVFITLTLDLIGEALVPNGAESWQLKRWWFYLGFNSVFAGELWFWSIHPFSNVPFWSLDYEVYYYLIFAATLIKNRTWRTLSVITIGLIVGPKVWLLLPCWWLGVSLFGYMQKPLVLKPAPANSSGLKFALPSVAFVIAYLAFCASGFPDQASQWVAPWHNAIYYSKNFIGDAVVALLFVTSVIWHARLNRHNSFNFGKAVATFAPHTFALYALHYPFLNLLAASSLVRQSATLNATVVILVAALCVAIGVALAPTRVFWRNGISRLFDVVQLRR